METPSISNYSTASNTYDVTRLAALEALAAATERRRPATVHGWSPPQTQQQMSFFVGQPQQQEPKTMTTTPLRIVQVFIADTDENVPVTHRLIYKGDQKVTELTDQELFFEIDINGLLKKHNETRTTLVDKKVKERVEHLQPVRIKDLKMIIVDVAKF